MTPAHTKIWGIVLIIVGSLVALSSIGVSILGVVWYRSGGEMAEFLSESLIWGGAVTAAGGLGALIGGVAMVRKAGATKE